jgi:hypothetical protein
VLKSRAAVSALLAAMLTVGLTACGFGAPQLPRTYDPSDGVGAEVGELAVRNALLVTTDGTRASLIVSVINQTDAQQALTVQYESTSATATGGRASVNLSVPASSTVTYGFAASDQVVLEGVDTKPGSLFPVYFQSGNAEGSELKVPVLDSALAEYSTLTPSPSPAAVVPSAVPTPISTPTPGTVPEGDNTGNTQPGDSVDSGQ